MLQEVGSSRLLRARVKMQEKYLEQYYDLYEDFHIVKLPLLEEEVNKLTTIYYLSADLIMLCSPCNHVQTVLSRTDM